MKYFLYNSANVCFMEKISIKGKLKIHDCCLCTYIWITFNAVNEQDITVKIWTLLMGCIYCVLFDRILVYDSILELKKFHACRTPPPSCTPTQAIPLEVVSCRPLLTWNICMVLAVGSHACAYRVTPSRIAPRHTLIQSMFETWKPKSSGNLLWMPF